MRTTSGKLRLTLLSMESFRASAMYTAPLSERSIGGEGDEEGDEEAAWEIIDNGRSEGSKAKTGEAKYRPPNMDTLNSLKRSFIPARQAVGARGIWYGLDQWEFMVAVLFLSDIPGAILTSILLRLHSSCPWFLLATQHCCGSYFHANKYTNCNYILVPGEFLFPCTGFKGSCRDGDASREADDWRNG